MADRVAIIGGSTVGRDHFPFPVVELTESDFGIGTPYPIPLQLSEAMVAFYLVKTWRITIDITRTVAPFPPDPIAGTYYVSAGQLGISSGPPDEGPYTRESDLVATRGTSGGDDTTTSNFAMFCSEEEISGASFGRMGWFDGLFYPMLLIDVDSSGGPSSYDEGSSAGNTAGDLSFSGRFLGLMSVDPGYSGTVDISPHEFWPYATKAGLPVYDTSDGSVLNDPFS